MRRITERDRWIARLLFDHQVLTTDHIRQLCFDRIDTARHRLVTLHRLGVVRRFRPFRESGSAPFHYVLGPIGVQLVARGLGLDPKSVRYEPERLVSLAGHPRLLHLIGVNSFFCQLAEAARLDSDCELVDWWSERQCAAEWGTIVRPDGYGIWRQGNHQTTFFLEYDRGTETLGRVAAKLDDYAELQAHRNVSAVVLFWFQSHRRAKQFLRMATSPELATATGNAHEKSPSKFIQELLR